MSDPEPILATSAPVGSGGAAPAMAATARENRKAARRNSLRGRTMTSGIWTVLGHGTTQVLRLASNIVLSWLLVREDFGHMALVAIFMQALQMFSDIGIGPSIIQSKRGDDPKFLNTAWTIQVFRGFALWGVACLIAYPVSLLWGEMLFKLLPIVGLTAVLQGFNSTRLQTMNRRLTVGWITMIEMGTQIVSIATMIGFALWIDASVWALVAGGFAGATTKLILSHTAIPGHPNRFAWDRSSVTELVRFGRWIFLSTIVTFLALHVNNLLYGALMSAAAMGVYWIGYQLAQVLPVLVKQVGSQVGFAALSELYRRNENDFRQKLAKVRFVLVVPINAGLILAILVGPLFINICYHTPYFGAGWIIQVLAINSLAGMLNSSYGHAYMATGSTFRNMVTVVAQLVLTVSATVTGYFLAGETGFLLGIGISQWLRYPVDAVLAATSGFWQWRFDFAVLASSAVLALGALWASPYLVLWFGRGM